MKAIFQSIIATMMTLILVSFADASPRGLSASRNMNEDFDSAYARHATTRQLDAGLAIRQTPVDVKKALEHLDTSNIPEVRSYEELVSEFKYIRDTRFMPSKLPNFPRRMTWLYPDDGCYARAELAADFLQLHNFAPPKKMFAFGNLNAKSDNSPYGRVTWWYHVAVTYRVDNVVYILDPALMPKRPMTLAEWHNAIGGPRSHIQYAVCDTGTFDPDFDCKNPQSVKIDDAQMEQSEFFDLEWDRVLRLKRNPEQELGNNPPWLQ